MTYRLLADSVVCFHLFFVVFVLCGGFLALRWHPVGWLHLPCALWGVLVEINGWICPLTHLENHLRQLSHETGYATSFVEHYLLPVIYPALWFPGGFPAWGFTLIGIGLLLLNIWIYGIIWRRTLTHSVTRQH
ncbi:MAG: DUF2784 domain-containing protein [Magnetococcales bacterium]|nr:DUF2784 domain-containing protein [Magnetococcales bacterium]